MASAAIVGSRNVGLLVDCWPEHGDSNLADAIDCLRELGLGPRVYAARQQGQGAVFAPGPSPNLTLATASSTGWRGLTAHLRRFACSPLRYLYCRGCAVLRNRPNLREFGRTVQLAVNMRRDGVVHLHACHSSSAALAATLGRLTGIPYSLTLEPMDLRDRSSVVLRRSLSAARFTITSTNAARQTARALAPNATIQRAYPGVDYRRYSPRLRTRCANVPLILAVGEARADWDLQALIEASQRLAARGIAFRCEVVGQARELAHNQALIDVGGLHQVLRLVGPLSEEQRLQRYSRATAFAQVPTSHADFTLSAIPSGMLEAMAMALPVVALRSRATEECLTHGTNGLLVSEGDAAELFQALQSLLQQPRLGEGLGAQARTTVIERFDGELNRRTLQELLAQSTQRIVATSSKQAHGGASPVQWPGVDQARGLPTHSINRSPGLHHA